jgi:hypothetical protein
MADAKDVVKIKQLIPRENQMIQSAITERGLRQYGKFNGNLL